MFEHVFAADAERVAPAPSVLRDAQRTISLGATDASVGCGAAAAHGVRTDVGNARLQALGRQRRGGEIAADARLDVERVGDGRVVLRLPEGDREREARERIAGLERLVRAGLEPTRLLERFVLQGRRAVLQLTLATVLPGLPLLLLVFPIRDIIDALAKVVL